MELDARYKPSELGPLPKEWEVKSVRELVELRVLEKPLDGNHGEIHPKSSDYVTHGIPFIMASNVTGGRVDLDGCKHIRKEQADTLRKGFARTGDVLLTHKGTVGQTALLGPLPYPYLMLTPQVTYYRVTVPALLSSEFLRQYFDSERFQALFTSLSGGGTRAYLGIEKQLDLPIIVPPIAEQRAMAAVLSDVDALLGALDRLIAKKRDLKQAAMQQLLTGQTRLPGFSGKWIDATIGDRTAKVGSGITPTGGASVYRQEGRPFIRSQNVGWGTLLLDDVVFINEETHQSFRATEIETGDVFLNITGASIGRSAIADQRINGGNVNQHVCIIRPLPTELDARYLNCFLLSSFGQRQIDSFQAGGNRQGLNFAQIRSFRIKHPPIAEQRAIAEVIADMDAELTALEQRRDKTRLLKQGMMQELLTGRTRLI